MQQTENMTLADLATSNTAPRQLAVDAVPFVVVPDGYSVVPLEHTLSAPVRPSGTIRVRDAASLIEMVARGCATGSATRASSRCGLTWSGRTRSWRTPWPSW